MRIQHSRGKIQRSEDSCEVMDLGPFVSGGRPDPLYVSELLNDELVGIDIWRRIRKDKDHYGLKNN